MKGKTRASRVDDAKRLQAMVASFIVSQLRDKQLVDAWGSIDIRLVVKEGLLAEAHLRDDVTIRADSLGVHEGAVQMQSPNDTEGTGMPSK